MLNCYIVDDEPHAISVLKRHIDQTPGLNFGGSDTNAMEAWQKLSDRRIIPELLFLDIDMPQISGVALAKLVKDMAKVIFTTAHPDYALAAFEVDAVDYLLKPVSYERFLRSVTKAKSIINKNPDRTEAKEEFFYVKSNIKGRMIRIKLEDIIYIEAKGNYVEINDSRNKRPVYLPLKDLEKQLPADKFIRVHKSFIINLKHVIALENGQIVMEDDSKITIGPRYKNNLSDAITPMLVSKKFKRDIL